VPVRVEEQVAIIHAGASGGIAEVPVSRIAEFEKGYLEHLRANHADLLGKVSTEKWTAELAGQFDEVCKAFVAEFVA